MRDMRALRYLAPNLVTTANLVFGLLSIAYTMRGEYHVAAWFIIYAVLGDLLDGLVARAVRGTSELGVQLDSFADFLNFGVAPAFLVYGSVGGSPALPFTSGTNRVLLMIACASWVLAATFRLARYNITPDDETPRLGSLKIFFGVPTTLAASLLIAAFLTFYKYGPPGDTFPALPEAFGGPRLLGDVVTPLAVWIYFPLALPVGAYLMASTLRMPKLGVMRSKLISVICYGLAVAVGLCGFARVFPEYMLGPPALWTVGFLIWGQLSPVAKSMKPPPIFPPRDPAPGAEPTRPEDHMLPDGTEPVLDPDPAPAPSSSSPSST
jgi:CDP-diacylglycerol---serine O-phosphatidyltransferase